MNRNEIEDMAREAGFGTVDTRILERFAALVAAAERERLAVLFETYKEVNADIIPESHDLIWRSNTIASFIRARGE